MKSITYILLLAVSLTLVHADLSCECGIENVSPRIIRGQEVSHKSRYPWMVFVKSVLFKGFHGFAMELCTGSVINDRFILTAAHCLNKRPGVWRMSVSVFISMHCKSEGTGVDDGWPVKTYTVHERYTGSGNFYDIALIELAEPLKFTQTFSPICFPNFTGYDNFLAAGWGQKDGDHPIFGTIKADTDCLREADLDVVDEGDCKRHWPYLDQDMALCAGGKTNVCQGDSGGPLMTRKGGNMYQVGIGSFARTDCGIATETPAVFEKVSAHFDWIRSKTRNAKWCKATRSALF